jgi:hypothetical protein
MSDQDIHLCIRCYEVNKGYAHDDYGYKRCVECKGTVLFLQEAADHIAELQGLIEEGENEDRSRLR